MYLEGGILGLTNGFPLFVIGSGRVEGQPDWVFGLWNGVLTRLLYRWSLNDGDTIDRLLKNMALLRITGFDFFWDFLRNFTMNPGGSLAWFM